VSAAAADLRAILERESALRLGLKRARAARFLACLQSGAKSTEAWQQLAVDPELQALEDAYEAARIDLAVNGQVPDAGEQ
jgi:hypothetical protein